MPLLVNLFLTNKLARADGSETSGKGKLEEEGE
jgi:hypothetical protein